MRKMMAKQKKQKTKNSFGKLKIGNYKSYLKADDIEELENLFKKIENIKEFQKWFGKPCPDFHPLCYNCKFWNLWNGLKLNVFEGI